MLGRQTPSDDTGGLRHVAAALPRPFRPWGYKCSRLIARQCPAAMLAAWVSNVAGAFQLMICHSATPKHIRAVDYSAGSRRNSLEIMTMSCPRSSVD